MFAKYMERSMIFVQNKNSERIKMLKADDGEMLISVDLHYMYKEEARRLLAAIIDENPFEFCLEVIHGFNHGTVLKNMVRDELKNRRIVKKYSPVWNPGSTYLVIA